MDSQLKIVPELLCTDIVKTKRFYLDVFGFKVKYEREGDKFVYFTLNGVDLMAEEVAGPGRRWITGELTAPLGRGVNFQWEVKDLDPLYERVKRLAAEQIFVELEEKSYECGGEVVRQRQFLVQDLDGYLFRFAEKN